MHSQLALSITTLMAFASGLALWSRPIPPDRVPAPAAVERAIARQRAERLHRLGEEWVAELEDLRRLGVGRVVFEWPAFDPKDAPTSQRLSGPDFVIGFDLLR